MDIHELGLDVFQFSFSFSATLEHFSGVGLSHVLFISTMVLILGLGRISLCVLLDTQYFVHCL